MIIAPDPITSAALCFDLSRAKAAHPCGPLSTGIAGFEIGGIQYPVNPISAPEAKAMVDVLLGYKTISLSPGDPLYLGSFPSLQAGITIAADGGRAVNLLAARAATYLLAQKIEEVAESHGASWGDTYEALLEHGFRPFDGWMAAIAQPDVAQENIDQSNGVSTTKATDIGVAWLLARNALYQGGNLHGSGGFSNSFDPVGNMPVLENEYVLFADANGGTLGTYPGAAPLVVTIPTPGQPDQYVMQLQQWRDPTLWASTDQNPTDFGDVLVQSFTRLATAITGLDKTVMGVQPFPAGTPGSAAANWGGIIGTFGQIPSGSGLKIPGLLFPLTPGGGAGSGSGSGSGSGKGSSKGGSKGSSAPTVTTPMSTGAKIGIGVGAAAAAAGAGWWFLARRKKR